MATQTPNFSFELPEVGADTDVWGGFLNSNWSDLDTLLKTLQDEIAAAEVRAQIPVGGLYFSGSDDTPATTLGYGTWVAHAEGRAIVGVGANGESTWAVDEERGEEEHLLLEATMPAHVHLISEITDGVAESAGAHTHSYEDKGEFSGAGTIANTSGFGLGDTTRTTASNGAHTHSVTIPQRNTAAKGGTQPHNNIQPSIGVYVWRRTA